MRLGLIARADHSGLGVQCLEFHRHMHPDRVLVIDVGHLYDRRAHANKRTDLSLYPDAIRCEGWIPSQRMLREFLNGLDVVFSCETFYHMNFAAIARQYGVRTVLQPNFEFLDMYASPDLWAPPTLWHYDQIPEPKQLLPVPIATERFTPRTPGDVLTVLHIVGRPAVYDRAGTTDLISCLQYVRSDVRVVIRCQDESWVPPHRHPPPNVELVVHTADTDNYWDNYSEGDVCVLPRRFGGLCLPAQEAIGAGLVVVMPDIEPNQWLPQEWLVPATKTGSFRAKQHVDIYSCDLQALAAKIDWLAETSLDVEAQKARDLAKGMSWETLKPIYDSVLSPT